MVKAKKKVRQSGMHTVGVRFINGANIGKVYHYKVPRRAAVHLGQPLVVDNDYGISVVIVVSIDKVKPATDLPMHLKTITQKVAPL